MKGNSYQQDTNKILSFFSQSPHLSHSVSVQIVFCGALFVDLLLAFYHTIDTYGICMHMKPFLSNLYASFFITDYQTQMQYSLPSILFTLIHFYRLPQSTSLIHLDVTELNKIQPNYRNKKRTPEIVMVTYTWLKRIAWNCVLNVSQLFSYICKRLRQRCCTKHTKQWSRNPRGACDFILQNVVNTETKALICNCSRQMYLTQTHTCKHTNITQSSIKIKIIELCLLCLSSLNGIV